MHDLHGSHTNWLKREDDERFLNLYDMGDHFAALRQRSSGKVVSTRAITIDGEIADSDGKALAVVGKAGIPFFPTSHAFGQLCSLAGAGGATGFLRSQGKLGAAKLAADNLNFALQFLREPEDTGLLVYSNGTNLLRAATGPKYGRIWNIDILRELVARVGDGVTGQFRVPGEMGVQGKPVTKESTTLYAGEEDCWIFLADETNRIHVPNRRGGQAGEMARGFIIWNSEVGGKTFGICRFLFDYMCCNHFVWGLTQAEDMIIRHTVSAPDKWQERALPLLDAYSRAMPDDNVENLIAAARQAKLKESVEDFLRKRSFTKPEMARIVTAHELDEHRPMETLFDVATGITAMARNIDRQTVRTGYEREATKILEMAL